MKSLKNMAVRATVQKNAEYCFDGKCPTLTAAAGMGGGNVPLYADHDTAIRFKGKYIDKDDRLLFNKLSPLECERLQTVPDNYTASVSNSQRYKMLGNGWTIDVIAHIFKNLPVKPLNVLSLFDGMSCGQLALQRAGIPVKNYFASEIDKPAITVTMANFPNTIQLGSVLDVHDMLLPEIDLLIGGSPCQGFSFAGKQLNFDDPRSKLFFEFVRLKEECKPKYFFLENVKMKKEYQDIISKFLGVEPIEINSALVSAQNRKRLYWTNIPGITQPKDKGILLKDILEHEVHEHYLHSNKAIDYMGRPVKGGRNHFDFGHHSSTDNTKSSCITANIHKGVLYNCLLTTEAISRIARKHPNYGPKINPDKTGTLNTKNNSGQLSIDGGTTLMPYGYYLRRLTEVECERLQTVPENYTASTSTTQRFRMLGNGWTVDVIAHIFRNIA